jgi:hypothetical protein
MAVLKFISEVIMLILTETIIIPSHVLISELEAKLTCSTWKYF